MKKIYLDYAATTPVDPRVLRAMLPYFTKKFGNSASLHSFGREAREALEESRQSIARIINASPKEIFFTASATESNNWALKGIASANKNKGQAAFISTKPVGAKADLDKSSASQGHIIISSIEHDCVLNSARALEKSGFEVSIAPVNQYGFVNIDDIKKLIRSDTILVSIIHANNEIGTIQDIAKIGGLCRQKGVLFHTDASQSFGREPIDMVKMNIDILTASSHKIYGPKGAALLYIRQGVKIEPLLHGGGHESGFRSSTINIPAIVGFAKAAEIMEKTAKAENARLAKIRDKIIKTILKIIPNSYLNGHPLKRLANNINFRFDFIEGESLLMELDSHGIAVSTASACSSPKLEPSHVLLACGLKHEQAHGSLRISLGRFTKQSEVDYLLKVLPLAVKKLRKMSPFKH